MRTSYFQSGVTCFSYVAKRCVRSLPSQLYFCDKSVTVAVLTRFYYLTASTIPARLAWIVLAGRRHVTDPYLTLPVVADRPVQRREESGRRERKRAAEESGTPKKAKGQRVGRPQEWRARRAATQSSNAEAESRIPTGKSKSRRHSPVKFPKLTSQCNCIRFQKTSNGPRRHKEVFLRYQGGNGCHDACPQEPDLPRSHAVLSSD